MSKKNKSTKKHSFKHSTSESAGKSVESASARAGALVVDRDFSYVTRDLRRLSLFLATLLVLEVGLWFAFNNTGLGSYVYNLVG